MNNDIFPICTNCVTLIDSNSLLSYISEMTSDEIGIALSKLIDNVEIMADKIEYLEQENLGLQA